MAALPGEKLAELKNYSSEKVQETMAAFLRALPALKQAGYDLREFEIELGLTPKIIAHFTHGPARDEDAAAARETLRDNRIGQTMLGVLAKAAETHRQIKAPGLHCAHMEIDVGLLPAVRLRYRAGGEVHVRATRMLDVPCAPQRMGMSRREICGVAETGSE